MAGFATRRVLIAVRTYPVPATKSIEASCTAGISDDGKWVRLFPVPYRLMNVESRFSKWQWINADMTKATNDARPESFKLNIEKVSVGEKVNTANGWRERWQAVRPLIRPSMCQIRRDQDSNGPTLGLFKPRKIDRLVCEPETADWTQAELAALTQDGLFQKAPKQTLEKIPFKFKYEFHCDDDGCNGHTMSCTDWEMAEAYRRWRKEYGDDWEKAFRQKFEREMIEKHDTHFFVGTIHQHPKNWIIVGLFYPPKAVPQAPDLFGGLN